MKTRGQASIEIIIIVAVVVIVSMLIVNRYLVLHEDITILASARQKLISEVEKAQTKYAVLKVDTAQCQNDIKFNITIRPNPETLPANAPIKDSEVFREGIKKAINADLNPKGKTITVSYNTPTSLKC